MTAELKTYDRNTDGLRQALFDEIEALRNGKGTVADAYGIVALSEQIIESLKIDLLNSELRLSRERKVQRMLGLSK